jgi:hypothetical protein
MELLDSEEFFANFNPLFPVTLLDCSPVRGILANNGIFHVESDQALACFYCRQRCDDFTAPSQVELFYQDIAPYSSTPEF